MVDAIGKIIEITESPLPNGSEFINGRSSQFMQNVQKVNQFEPENKCPDCVFMRLEIKPVETKTGIPLMNKTEVNSLELFLTLNFSLQKEEEIFSSKIQFGIKTGTLRLTLTNCTSPYEARHFIQELQPEILLERETKYSDNYKTSLNSSLSPTDIKAQVGSDSQQHKEEVNKFKTTICQVSSTGSENNPAWDFQVGNGNSCLRGKIGKEGEKPLLATLKINNTPCLIEAIFTTEKLNIEGVKGMMWDNKKISNNRTAIIAEAYLQRRLGPKFQPYLSKQELRYD
ncbi:hypothetical protein [Laspinema olomoucense]|uniref:hypothetical protein n=1 Tax=Laspinema olomoucense TaxID=3231600 RepID=UPI0021BB49BD|nr:hypothetical protein [Laspinema sp. D3c]MCT7992446.1 hypothetical protein [Laspinema sp. D3c]